MKRDDVLSREEARRVLKPTEICRILSRSFKRDLKVFSYQKNETFNVANFWHFLIFIFGIFAVFLASCQK